MQLRSAHYSKPTKTRKDVMHSETTDILDMSGEARVQRRHEGRKRKAVEAELAAIAKLLDEGWHISYTANGNWSATLEKKP